MPDLYASWGKRALDVTIAGCALLILTPVVAGVALAARLIVGGPVVFRQRRTGKGGRPFEILKFRTMTGARGPDGTLRPDAERLTPFGRWLRRSSLDELPELINVIRGDMSLVGPRPLLTEYVDRYTPEQARRHEVRPGITGWAQVNGRNATTWPERFRMDVWYVDHMGLGLDLAIVARTLVAVVRGDGIAAAGHASMPEFEGGTVRRPHGRIARGVLAAALLGVGAARAQTLPVGDPVEDYLRVLQLLAKTDPGPMLLRPVQRAVIETIGEADHPWSGRLPPVVARRNRTVQARFESSSARLYVNSDHPVVANDGIVWQGKGLTLYGGALGWMRAGPVTLELGPEVAYASNAAFPILPPLGTGLSEYADPWYGIRLDRPQRFGDGGYGQVGWGQSSLRVDVRGWAAGLTTANAWWGPGQDQAVLLTNQAAGFPRAFLGTGRPVDIGIGRAEVQWIWGGLHESGYLDAADTNDVRYVTGLAADLELDAVPGLYLGGARLFYLDWPGGGLSAGDILLPLQGLTKQTQQDSLNPSGDDLRDQMISLYLRWVFPRSGFEVYGEWSRNDHAQDWQDFVLQVEHAQAFVAGLQKAWQAPSGSILRVRAELTHLELPKTLLDRPTPTFYQHHRAIGGYTHFGQVVGAVAGPGGNAQLLDADWFAPWGSVGGFLRRDVHDNDTYYRLRASGAITGIRRNDVELTVGARAMLFVGDLDLSGLLAVGREWNRYYEDRNDVTNLHAEIGVRWRPRW